VAGSISLLLSFGISERWSRRRQKEDSAIQYSVLGTLPRIAGDRLVELRRIFSKSQRFATEKRLLGLGPFGQGGGDEQEHLHVTGAPPCIPPPG
jgi:hypothetical protein